MSFGATAFLAGLGRTSLQAAVLAVVVGIVVHLMRRRLSAAWRFNLWALVFLRLLIPVAVAVRLPAAWLHLSSHGMRPAAVKTGGESVVARYGDVAPAGSADRVIAVQTKAHLPISLHTLAPCVFLLWAAGLVIMVARLVRSSVYLHRLLGRCAPVKDARVNRLLEEAAEAMSLRRRPVLLLAPPAMGAALAGMWRPRLLLPQRLLDQLSVEELRLVMLHELAHLRRFDVLNSCVISLLLAVHWFNPLVWWAAARARDERELACDELAICASKLNSEAPALYGQLLLKLIQPAASSSSVSAAPLVVGMFKPRQSLHRRIVMIARYRPANRWSALLGSALALPLLAVGFTSAAPPSGGAADAANIPASQPSATAASSRQTEGSPSTAMDSDTQADAVANNLLSHRLQELRFNANSFSDVIDFLRDVTHAGIFVDWNAIEAAGISKKAAITVQIRSVPFSTALDLVLQSASSPKVQLAYDVENGVIHVSTSEQLSNRIVTHVYDLAAMGIGSGNAGAVANLIAHNVQGASCTSYKDKVVVTAAAINQPKIAALLRALVERDSGASAPTAPPRH